MSRLRAAIEELDDEGRGVLVHDGVRVHVAGALPGERVLCELEHRSPHRPEAWARLVALENPSPARVAPVCPATGRCGGCPLGILAYEAQLAWKAGRLARATADVPGAAAALRPIAGSPRPTGYRGVSKLVYARGADGAPVLGGYAPRSHEVIDLAGCRVVEPPLEALRAHLLGALGRAGVEPHDARARRGALAHVVLRASARGDVLATLVGPDLDALAAIAAAIPPHPALVGIAGNQKGPGNAIFGAETRVLVGRGELEEQVGPVTLLLSPTAFFQVNREAAARIYADLADGLGTDGAIVDAYAGVGGIALTLWARGARAVSAVEVNAAAVRDAERAAARAGASIAFSAADAATGLRARGPVEAVVVNPPRRGLDDATRAALVALRPPRLGYVSCDPETLARDLRVLVADGYQLRQLGAYDMHPQTPHVETLAILTRDRV